MRRILGSVLAASILCFGATVGAPPALAQAAPEITNITFPLDVSAFVPCANDGAGESVLVSGVAHFIVHQLTDSAGGTHFLLFANYQRMSGFGAVTGDRYLGISTSTSTAYNFAPFVGPPYSLTSVQSTRFIGPGPNNNLILLTQIHFTYNANDEVAVDRYLVEVVCT